MNSRKKRAQAALKKIRKYKEEKKQHEQEKTRSQEC